MTAMNSSILLVEDNHQDELLTLGTLRKVNVANSFVRKPVDFTEFAETIARLGIYWSATNLPPQA